MRLTEKQITALCDSFKESFPEGDHLWLFGSRTDDSKRGGDIDLYIETQDPDITTAYNRKFKFNSAIQRKIGAQKIDIIIKLISSPETHLIHQEARRTGILLV